MLKNAKEVFQNIAIELDSIIASGNSIDPFSEKLLNLILEYVLLRSNTQDAFFHHGQYLPAAQPWGINTDRSNYMEVLEFRQSINFTKFQTTHDFDKDARDEWDILFKSQVAKLAIATGSMNNSIVEEICDTIKEMLEDNLSDYTALSRDIFRFFMSDTHFSNSRLHAEFKDITAGWISAYSKLPSRVKKSINDIEKTINSAVNRNYPCKETPPFGLARDAVYGNLFVPLSQIANPKLGARRNFEVFGPHLKSQTTLLNMSMYLIVLILIVALLVHIFSPTTLSKSSFKSLLVLLVMILLFILVTKFYGISFASKKINILKVKDEHVHFFRDRFCEMLEENFPDPVLKEKKESTLSTMRRKQFSNEVSSAPMTASSSYVHCDESGIPLPKRPVAPQPVDTVQRLPLVAPRIVEKPFIVQWETANRIYEFDIAHGLQNYANFHHLDCVVIPFEYDQERRPFRFILWHKQVISTLKGAEFYQHFENYVRERAMGGLNTTVAQGRQGMIFCGDDIYKMKMLKVDISHSRLWFGKPIKVNYQGYDRILYSPTHWTNG